MRKNRMIGGIAVILGGLLSIIGSIMPWAKVESVFGSISKNGTQGDGIITLVAGIIALIMGLIILTVDKYDIALVFGVLAAIACFGIAIYDLVDLSSKISGLSTEYAIVKAGEGIYIVIIGGIIALVGAIIDRVGALTREPAKNEYSFCPYCGQYVLQGDVFCRHCGGRFSQQAGM